jgi:hypothetical protein
MSNPSSNMNNKDSASFDLFAKPESDDLAEHLAKGSHQWTNKYTKFLGITVIVVALLSAGAWYGHHSATSAANSSLGTSLNSLRSAFGGAAGATGAAAAGGFGGGGGGFGGVRVTGTITKVAGSSVTMTLDNPTQSGSLKSGDAARITDMGAGAVPVAPQASVAPKSSSKSATTPKPAVSAAPSGGGRGGFFSDPAVQACLTKAGVTITPGARPDRTDPKVAAAFAKCLPGFGQGRGGAPQSAPTP